MYRQSQSKILLEYILTYCLVNMCNSADTVFDRVRRVHMVEWHSLTVHMHYLYPFSVGSHVAEQLTQTYCQIHVGEFITFLKSKLSCLNVPQLRDTSRCI